MAAVFALALPASFGWTAESLAASPKASMASMRFASDGGMENFFAPNAVLRSFAASPLAISDVSLGMIKNNLCMQYVQLVVLNARSFAIPARFTSSAAKHAGAPERIKCAWAVWISSSLFPNGVSLAYSLFDNINFAMSFDGKSSYNAP